MPVTNLHVTSGKHYCGEDTVSVDWDYSEEKGGVEVRKALWVSAKTGRSHFGTCPAKHKKPPDDPLVDYFMAECGMKKAAARLMARKIPKKGTEAERMMLALQVYDREGKA